MIKVVKNFHADITLVLTHAQESEYKDITIERQTFPKIAISTLQPYLYLSKVEQILEKKLYYSLPPHYRKYIKEDKQPTFIHSDVYDADYTVVIFLNKINKNNGLAFYEHPIHGDRATKGMYLDYNKEPFHLKHIIKAQLNTAVIFEAAMFHSRWPKFNCDTGGEDRLVKIMFLKEVK